MSTRNYKPTKQSLYEDAMFEEEWVPFTIKNGVELETKLINLDNEKEETKMKSLTYTNENKYNRAIITICLQKEDDIISRGVAMCSKRDHPDDTGIAKAEGRATKARKRKESDLPINRDEAIRLLFETDTDPFKFKSEYAAHLTPYEMTLFLSNQVRTGV